MTAQPAVAREPRVIALGILLVFLGIALLFDRLNLFAVHWSAAGWVLGAFIGIVFMVDGFLRKRRGRIFWGSFLAFECSYWALARWDVVHHHGFFVLPSLLIALGLSFAMLYAQQPRELGLLIPATIFAGTGVVLLLWWWEVLEWYEVRYALQTYWPVLLVLWGVALILRRVPKSVSNA